jgi:hypothetical protein
MLKLFAVAGAALTTAALLAGPAAATTAIYDNLGAQTSAVDPLSAWRAYPNPADSPESSSFSTGAGGFLLSDVQLLLSVGPDAGHFTVSLLADDNTSPGAVIASTVVADNDLPDDFLTVDFKLSASLAANTRYWIQLSSTDDSSAAWAYATDTSGLGVAGEYYDCPSCGGVTPNDEPYQMAILGDVAGAVPEPASWAMMLIGLFGLGTVLRARRTDQPAAVAA